MASALQPLLSSLHDSLLASDDKRAHDIVSDIGHYVLEDVSNKETDYCCSLLFDKDTGVVPFFKLSATLEQFQYSKSELLDTLLAFSRNVQKRILPYALDIKNVCISLFIRERLSKVKSSALALLIEIIRLASGSNLAQDLQISKMIDKFFMELIHTSRHPPTIKSQIYNLLGVFAEAFPETMIAYSDRLFDVYIRALREQMTSKTKKPELSIIAGCLQGLTCLLVHFTQSAEEGAKHAYDIFRYTRMAIDTDIKVTRYEMSRSALTLLHRHAAQFDQFIFDDHQTMYERLAYWGNHSNPDMRHLGMLALEACLKQISHMLVEKAKHGQMNGATFKFFIQKFRVIMDDPTASSKQVNLAIRGYGYFAAPCRIFLSSDDVKFMFNEMIQRSEQIFGSGEELEDKMIQLPSFLEALASIVRELSQISENFLLSLERLTVLLMEGHTKMNKKMHYGAFLAILKVLFALSGNGAVFRGFLSRIVYQGLIRTCSRPIVVETEVNLQDNYDDQEIDEKNQITYCDYLPLWSTLLDTASVKELAQVEITLEERHQLTKMVYDELISSMIKIMDRLDLTSSRSDDDEVDMDMTDDMASPVTVTSDPIQGLHAARPKDFVIFINLVDFSKDLLPKKHVELFQPWVLLFCQEVIVHSTENPLVSGFYKMLAVCMHICAKMGFFKNLGKQTHKLQTEIKTEVTVKFEGTSMETDDHERNMGVTKQTDMTQKEAAFLLISKFTKEVVTRMKQYKEDLLAACLVFTLSLPQEIALPLLSSVIPAMQLALHVGRSYLPLAVVALEALERWSCHLPPEIIQPYYPDILPHLDTYLRSTLDNAADKTISITSTKPGPKYGRKKIPIKLLKKSKLERGISKIEESQLSEVRHRIVKLLGSLGGAVNQALVSNKTEDIAKVAVAWDTTKHLKFDMPFMDIKPTIYFDTFLPRIIELATSSSDRQTKVAACELLHSLVLYMIGRGAQKPAGRAGKPKEPMDRLYAKIMPALLQLACDVEQVAKQLFETLVMQLVHWFSSSKQFESPEVRALLEALMDGLVSPTDMALRDFCAQAVKEYLRWAIKQTSKKELEKSPVAIISLLKRIYSLARHPSAFKRLGATLAFNNIYTVFREEEILVDMFTFELLVIFVDSLAIAHTDDKSLGTQEQCKKSLEHIERIIRTKSDLLSKETKLRKKPKGWPKADMIMCLRWLLRQCGRPQTECRHSCMRLLCKLAPCVEGISDAGEFLKIVIRDLGNKHIIQRFESGLYKAGASKTGLLHRPTMVDMGNSFNLQKALSWFDILLAPLDCYTWVIGERLLSPSDAMIVSENKGTVVFKSLTYFFTNLGLGNIETAAKLFDEMPENLLFTPREISLYNKAKCTVLVRTMDFLMTMLGTCRQDAIKVIPGSFFTSELWETLLACVLEPSSVGFDMADVEIMMNLPIKSQQLFAVLLRNLPSSNLTGLEKCLSQKILSLGSCDLLSKLPSSLADSSKCDVHLTNMVAGYEQLHMCGMLHNILSSGGKNTKMATSLLEYVHEGIVKSFGDCLWTVQLEPSMHSLARQLLQLAFLLGIKATVLLDLLLDKTDVTTPGMEAIAPRGLNFYTTFKSTINRHLVKESQQLLPALIKCCASESGIVGSLLLGMMEQVGRDKNLRKKEGVDVVDSLLKNWPQLSCWWKGQKASHETKTLALTLLTKVIVVNSKAVSDVKHKSFDHVFNMYLDLLTDSSSSLAFKTHVLDLLPFFCSLPENYLKKLKSGLDQLVADNFPTKSTEYPEGSPKYNNYISALNKILSGLELSGSMMLLELLISIMCKEQKHVYEEEIQNTLVRFIKRLPTDSHKIAVNVAYNIFVEDKRFTPEQRRSAMERVGVSMLRLINTSQMSLFFVDHIRTIMEIIEAKTVKGSESALENQLVSKLCSFQMMELMYSRLSKDEVFSKPSSINSVYCKSKPETGKEMTSSLMKAANAAKGEDMRGEIALIEMRRHYHCAAYNALIAVISCTQTDLKFYRGFLFQEDSAKGQFLLDNLIDTDKKYTFDVEMQSPLARRKKFVSIRNEVREARRDGSEDEDAHHTKSVHYLASQYLADSSLGAVVSQFDFGSSVKSSVFSSSSGSSSQSLGGYERVYRKESLPESTMESMVTVKDDYVEMEMDELNQHECMASLTALLQHMRRNNITPTVEKGVKPSELPSWMSYFHKKLQGYSTNRNVKLFICKLIVNAEEVFRPYARFWLAPIVQCLTRGDFSDKGINYFVIDLVVTILSWNTVAIPEDNTIDRAMASSLVEFLVKNGHHDNRSVLKNNLEVLKTLVEVWCSVIDVPTKALYENFNDPNPKTSSNAAGIQMSAVFIANKLAPYKQGCGLEKEKFYKLLAMNMNKDHKAVYAAAAETVGMLLALLSATEKGTESAEWRKSYIDKISEMLLNVQHTKPDQFITCVHGMQLHYPPVADKFLSKTLFLLPRLHGEFRVQCLDIICGRLDALENAYLELKSIGLVESLSHRDEALQHSALKIVKGLLRHMKATELLELLPAVVAFTSNPSVLCRSTMFDILIWTFDNYRNDESTESHSILSQTKECLLAGLADSDLKNRLTVQNFWSHETRLPAGTLERLVAMLEAMYSTSCEENYLSYATNLLLEMTSKSPDYNREIFEHPLSECKFQDYNVASSWRHRHVAMTPLFAQTQSTQSQGGSLSDVSATGDVLMTGELRATQDVQQFSATQEAGGRGPYNWLTQSSLDTYADNTISLGSETQSSLLFTVGKSSKKPNSVKLGKSSNQFKIGKDQTDGKEDQNQNSEILRLKKRFIKDNEAARLFHIKRMTRIKKMREEKQREQKQKRENQVTMYRRYRIGDLPDIQIKYSYIIAPLQALAQRDNLMARLLFSALFKAIFSLMDEEKTEREGQEITEKINNCFNEMLSSSTQYYQPFVACILDIAHEFPRKIKLDPSNIHTTCTTSLQQPLGIVLLENMLIQCEGESERPTKRSRGMAHSAATASVSAETTSWVELARIYKSVGDYDVLRGIFSSRFGTQQLTLDAMEAEMRGDYAAAAKLYTQGLEDADRGVQQPNEVEQDLWDEGRLQCYNHLTQWDRLELIATQNIDDVTPKNLNKIWEDTYLQDQYLPFLFRSKLKQLLEGDEQQTLGNFVDAAMKISDRKAVLENRYCEELSLLYLWQDDFDRARHYTNMAVETFLRDWSGMDSLMAASRSSRLQTLQKLTELREFLEFTADDTYAGLRMSAHRDSPDDIHSTVENGNTVSAHFTSNFSAVQPANKLVDKWLDRSPDALMDPAGIWDDVITNRSVYADKLCERLERSDITMNLEPEVIFTRHKVSLRLAQAAAARRQHNFPVAFKLLKDTHKYVKALKEVPLDLKWTHTYARTHQLKSQVTMISTNEKLLALTGSMETLKKMNDSSCLAEMTSLGCDHWQLQGEACAAVTKILQNEVMDLSKIPADLLQKVQIASGSKKVTHDEIVGCLVNQGYNHMKLGVSFVQNHGGHCHRSIANTAYLILYKYCDKYLKQQENSEENIESLIDHTDEFPVTMVTMLLEAMQNNSSEARQRFPRLLQLVELYPACMDTLIRKIKGIPCWMFLAWMGQMTALLDKTEAPAVKDVLIEICDQYPNALVYPFKLSVDSYCFTNDAVGRDSQAVCEKLNEKLSKVAHVSELITALEQFGQPNHMFKDWCFDGELRKLMQKSIRERDKQRLIELYKDMYNCVIGEGDGSVSVNRSQQQKDDQELYGSQTMSLHSGNGPYRNKFGKQFRNAVDNLLGKDAKKLLTMSYEDFERGAREINTKMEAEVKKNLEPPCKLKEYSPWLASWQSTDHETQLEIPGQYTGLQKPLPEYHTMISSIDERVMVLTSIRKPKAVVIRGNDEKEYRYLVKCGEDLRQDQRIEQLFILMNDIFTADPVCRQRRLYLRTYQVIPMTPRVGLIEWMEHTIPLKNFLYDTMTNQEKAFSDSKGPGLDYQQWLPKGKPPQNYFKAYEIYSRSDTLTAFRRRENLVPWDLFRRGYIQMSSSPEAFFTLKANFAISHGQLSICQYILGIGDRHLSNFMVDLQTGKMVGIDFGHAFGSATQFLPIPELMPIRLTRQLKGLLMPHKEKGLLEGVMIHTLRALRSHTDLLLATMDVFIKEPSLDWKQNAHKQIKLLEKAKVDVADLLTDMEWYPKQKIAYARKKLEGVNPAYLNRDELRLGHMKSSYYKYFERVLMGEKEVDIRAKLPHKGLTVEQQVACLLNQATDPNILGRAWAGWEPWM